MSKRGMQTYTKEFYEKVMGNSLASAREIVPLILRLIQPGRVIDVGCGRGDWLSVFSESGVGHVLGVDGDWVDRNTLFIPPECFLARDLAEPLRLNAGFDLALSLEVAEHFPAEFATAFVGSLAALASVIVFSAAIPFQGGTNHLNEQWPDYWAGLFRAQGFVTIDCLRRHIWQNENVSWWYAQNLLIFARLEYLETNSVLKQEYENNLENPLSVVHPRVFLEKVSQTTITSAARNTLSGLKQRVKNTTTGLIGSDGLDRMARR
jgi:SAM-dependent methyltransferase